MSGRPNFHRWLVIDWGTNGDTGWVCASEASKRFLLVTPAGKRWENDFDALCLPTDNFLLVLLLSSAMPLTEQEFALSRCLVSSSNLPIWCHYGGDIRLRKLE